MTILSNLKCISFALLLICGSAYAKERGLFLNGIDISSAKHQTLENVTVKIDGQGHIYIEAPHYEVNQESTYIPLSSWNQQPEHKPMGAIPSKLKEVGASESLPSLSNQVKAIGAPGGSKNKKPGSQIDINQGQIPSSQRSDQ